MDEDVKFGELLKTLIKKNGMTHSEFYSKLRITKPYFYDIIKSRVKPPPLEMQCKMLKLLNVSDENKKRFFQIAGCERNEVPGDIAYYLKNNPQIVEKIRKNVDYDSLLGGNQNESE